MPYYDTLKEPRSKKKFYEKKASLQYLTIKKYFEENPYVEKSPSQVWTRLFDVKKVPITSVRRAMTDLTTDDFLEKTPKKRPGLYDRSEHIWKRKLPPGPTQLTLFTD